MDSADDHAFGFNEGVSLMINCSDQAEIDHFWDRLSADPEAEQCGWLKDRFGVSWQVHAVELNDMLTHGTAEQVDRVTQTFLPMKKLDLAALRASYENAG
jgi:predicted 3-demethylubiquinone-9 3-methyltransferase (glyoxalase superfamily)